MIKIFYLDHSTDFSGGQKSLLALLSRIDLKFFEPTIVIDRKAKRFEDELIKLNLKLVKINYFNSPRIGILLSPILIIKLLILIQREKGDLIHCNTFKVGLIGAIVGVFCKSKVIFRSRLGVVVNSHGIIDFIIYKLSNLILANSNYVKETFFKRFNTVDKVNVIYNPLFEDYSINIESSQKLKERFFNNPSIFYFGSIGRIEPFKRQREIVEAVKILSKQEDKFKVIFFGAASNAVGLKYRDSLNSLIKEDNLDCFFEFAGFVTEINEATSLLDCVLLCTEGEPLSRGIFESQFIGTPVIASNSGGNPELIRHEITGLLYELNDPLDLSNKMKQIMESPELRAKLAYSGHCFIAKTFDTSNTIGKEQDIYRELLDSKKQNQ